jgi:hypothetical protein
MNDQATLIVQPLAQLVPTRQLAVSASDVTKVPIRGTR